MSGETAVNAMHTVAVGFDGSNDSRAALRWAASLAAATHASLKVVHAVGLLEHAGLSEHASPHQEVALKLAVDAGMDRSSIEWLVVDGDPCSALLRMNEPPYSVDLIVVGTRGAGEHSGSLLGSTSLELVEHSNIPVVIVPRQGSRN
jgi:nucleotide-binding universal stress UspA family protein